MNVFELIHNNLNWKIENKINRVVKWKGILRRSGKPRKSDEALQTRYTLMMIVKKPLMCRKTSSQGQTL